MWRKAKVGDVKYQWGESCVGLECSCGAYDIIVTAQDHEPKECDCGKKYRLVTYLEIWEEKE